MTNNQRDGMHKMWFNKERAHYNFDSMDGGCPFKAKITESAFNSFEERIDSRKIRMRSESICDHCIQPDVFYKSMSKNEKEHI